MTDHTLKKLFSELKKQDSQNVPNFQRMFQRQTIQADQETLARGWMPFAFAAALLTVGALLAFSILPKNDNHMPSEIEQWSAITNWTPSSDSILAENTPAIGVSISTSSDMLFEFPSVSSSPNTKQKL